MSLRADDSALWEMPYEMLADRVLRRDSPTASREEVEDLVTRSILRSETVLRYLNLTPAPPMMTLRHWEARWDAKAASQRVDGSLARLGWKIRLETERRLSPLAMAGGYAGARENVLLIDPTSAETLVNAFREAKSPFRVDQQTALVLMAAEEMFRLAAERMGNSPADGRVDDLAEARFVQDLLGLPFSPLAARLLRSAQQ